LESSSIDLLSHYTTKHRHFLLKVFFRVPRPTLHIPSIKKDGHVTNFPADQAFRLYTSLPQVIYQTLLAATAPVGLTKWPTVSVDALIVIGCKSESHLSFRFWPGYTGLQPHHNPGDHTAVMRAACEPRCAGLDVTSWWRFGSWKRDNIRPCHAGADRKFSGIAQVYQDQPSSFLSVYSAHFIL